MENEESVQETAAPSGNGEESSGVSAAEPAAPAEASSEPVAEARAESTESAPVSVESFPEVDSFDWDKWDGTDYEAFPEQVRPWVDKLSGRYAQELEGASNKNGTEIDYWKRMYEAMQYGDEDPRIGELTTKIEEANNREAEYQNRLDTLTKEINEEREAENSRYFEWFEKNYNGKLEELAKIHGAVAAEQMVIDLMDLDMDVHVAVEVSLMGTDAVNAAKVISKQVKDSALVLEIINSRFKGAKANVPEPPVERSVAPNPAAQVVAGSAPVSRPAQLTQEKGPVYGGGNERMSSIMAAAESAIRKSKRR